MSNKDIAQGRILVIEDESDLLDAVVSYLNLEGFTADGVSSLGAATNWMRTHQLDVVVLDLGLPDGDGLAWLSGNEQLKNKGVIVTTARGSPADRIEGARAGADNYLVKPVQLEELGSLLRNMLRRLQTETAQTWTLNQLNWTLQTPAGLRLKLTHSELLLLSRLAEQPGKTVARKDLVNLLGHDPDNYASRRMESLVRRLRNKAEEALNQKLPLETVYTQGYAFASPIVVEAA